MTVNLELAIKHLIELYKEEGEKVLLAASSYNMFLDNLKNNNELTPEAKIRNEEMLYHHTSVRGDAYHVHCELNYVLRHHLGVDPTVLDTICSELNEKYKPLNDS